MNLTCRCLPQSRGRESFRAHVVDAGRSSMAPFDPTGTLPLQRRFRRAMDARWKQVRRMLPGALTVRLDAINMINHASMTGQDPVRAFQAWLDTALQQVVLGSTGAWTLSYVRGAGDIGVARALMLLVRDDVTDAYQESEHPRAPDGKWTSKGGSITAFHGTTESAVKKIMKSGLKVKGSTRSFGGDLYKDERGRAVFVANTKKTADWYARQRVWNKGGKPAILELQIPKAEWKKFQKDTEHDGKGAAFATKSIPAKWIKQVHASTFYDAQNDDVTMWLVINVDEFNDDVQDAFVVDAVPVDRVPALQTLCITELQGIMEAVSQQCVRALANGLLLKQTPAAIGRTMQQVIDKTGIERTDLLVSFIVVRTFGAATLDVFRASGVDTVGTIAERTGSSNPASKALDGFVRDAKKKKPKNLVNVLSAGDDKVCLACQDIEDEGPYTLDEAEALIPAHPRCRCVFVPWHDARYAKDEFNEADHPRHPKGHPDGGKFAKKDAPQVGSDPKFEAAMEKLKSGATKGGYNFNHFGGNYGPSDVGGAHVLEIDNEHEIDVINAAAKHSIELTEVPQHSGTKFKAFTAAPAITAPTKFTPTNTTPETHGTIDMADMKKVGEQMGSNKGGVYESPKGEKFYIKEPKTKDHVQNELLAAKLYQAAGSSTMQYVPVKGDAHVATTLEALDKNNVSQFDDLQRQAAQKDFGVHAWLANHDAVGTGGDNQVVPKGSYWPSTVDVGGSLKYRAQGEPKGDLFGDTVPEIDTLRDPKINPDAAKLFGSMTNEEMAASIKRVTDIPNDKIDAIVQANMPHATDKERFAMTDKLISRKYDMAKQAEKMLAADPDATPYPGFKTVTGSGGSLVPAELVNKTAETPVFKTKMEHAKHLLMKGTTSDELKKALNWPAIGVPATADSLNLKLEKTKMAGGAFFYKGTPMTPEEIAAKGGKAVATGATVVPIKTSAQTPEFKSAPAPEFKSAPAPDIKTAFDPEPVPKHDINTPSGNFKQSLENNNVKYSAQPIAGGEIVTLSSPKDVSKVIEMSKFHPKAEKLSAHEYFVPSNDAPKSDVNAFTNVPATAAELKKAEKNTPLKMEYVPGAAALADHPKAKALVAEFNDKYAGKEYDPATLKKKVDDFKKLQSDIAPLVAAHEVNQKKAEAITKAATEKYKAEAAAKANAHPDFDTMSDEEERQYWYGKHSMDNSYLSSAQNAMSKKIVKESNLTVTEVGYIKAFTGSYSHVNEELRAGFMSESALAYKHIMNDALAKMPKYDGDKVWRKIMLDAPQQELYQTGKVVHWTQFSSTSKDQGTWSGNTHFTIHKPKSGVDVQSISSNPSEAEVIMPADTYYKVISKKQSGGTTYIEMEEVLPFGKKKKKAA